VPENEKSAKKRSMTATITDTPTNIKRCALCKIDRKGKFILADIEAERLFGYSEVELFGRLFTDFIDSNDHAAVEAMTRNHSGYETYYESARVTFLDKDEKRIEGTLIVSVNFGGGNPANYQVIINVEPRPGSESDADGKVDYWPILFKQLSDDLGDAELQSLAETIHVITTADSIAIYDATDDELQRLAAIGSEPDDDAAPTDDVAANEVRATFALDESRLGLVCISLGDDDKEDQRRCSEAVTDAIHALRPPVERGSFDSGSPDPNENAVRDFLRSLGIGLIEANPQGQIEGDSRTFAGQLGLDGDLETTEDLMDAIESQAGATAAAASQSCLENAMATDAPPSFVIKPVLSSGISATISVAPAGPYTDNPGTLFLISSSQSAVLVGRPDQSGLSAEIATQAVKSLRASVSASLGVGQRLEHEHHGELTRDGGFYLNCLSHHLENAARLLDDLDRTVQIGAGSKTVQTVDLELLVKKLSEALSSNHPNASLTIKSQELPKVKSYRRKLEVVLGEVFRTIAARADDDPVQAVVSAVVSNDSCSISIRDNGPVIRKKQLRKIFELGQSTAVPSPGSSGEPTGNLAIARELVKSMGGQIDIWSSEKDGTTATIIVPL
jgi:PAS domain S-box-containing protein